MIWHRAYKLKYKVRINRISHNKKYSFPCYRVLPWKYSILCIYHRLDWAPLILPYVDI
jgi:hypothetical protein